MPLRYVIHAPQRLVFTFAEGRVTFDEVWAHQTRMLNDPRFDPSYNQLTDFSATQFFDVSTEEAKQISQRQMFSPATKRPAVATSPHIFGLYRLMQVHHQIAHPEISVQVFRNREEALKWLGVPEDSGLYINENKSRR